MYRKIRKIDGYHPFQEAAPGSFLVYQVRSRPKGSLFYFNFPLAKKMGLIKKGHPHHLNEDLEEALLDSFSVQIINEFDILNKTKIPKETIRPKPYMATRYLALQHPNKQGKTSGDGRSIWNGSVTHDGLTWDISSCGTGATCFSPATAIHKKFYKTGDPEVSYGCGYSSVSEGLIDVMFSEILTRNCVPTERTLCIIRFRGGSAIIVRAGLNLIRPSHFFHHLKQNKLQRLKAVTDYYIQRQISNSIWNAKDFRKDPYGAFLRQVTSTFAQMTARFQSHYIFCWLDWDGDNILTNGEIIDFGSVRQFGLFHHEYRFDDDERWSSNIKEQRLKGRGIVQTFCQLVHYIKTGDKKPFAFFKQHPALKEYDRLFTKHLNWLFLKKVGFKPAQIELLLSRKNKCCEALKAASYYFETRKTHEGPQHVPDGITWNVAFNVRDLLRRLPQIYLKSRQLLSPDAFCELMQTSCNDLSFSLSKYGFKKSVEFQQLYLELVGYVASKERVSQKKVFKQLAIRSALINRRDRITGDAVCVIAELLQSDRNHFNSDEIFEFLHKFFASQVLDPDANPKQVDFDFQKQHLSHLARKTTAIILRYRESI